MTEPVKMIHRIECKKMLKKAVRKVRGPPVFNMSTTYFFGPPVGAGISVGLWRYEL